MNETKQPRQDREDSVTRTAFWGTLVLSVIDLSICSYFFSVLSQQTRTPIMYTAMAIFLLAILTALISLMLTLSRRQELAAKLVFGRIFVIGFVAVTLFEGRAISATISILVIAVMVIRWLFPSQAPRRGYLAFAIVSFLLMWVIEWINPSWRIQLEAGTFGPWAVIVFGLILGWIVFTQSRRFLYASVATSLRLQITVWMGAIVAALSIVILAYSIITSRQAAIDAAEAETVAIAESQAGLVKSQIDPALSTARTMAYNLRTVKDPANTTPLTRQQVNDMLRKVAEENPSFLGTWTIWEPNAFDGQDAKYANTSLHDATGRFIPYWSRPENTVEGSALLDYETPKPGINDWYFIPRETKQETLITPYVYPINGVDVLMTTVSVPIVENGQYYGVTGVDYRMDFVQGLVDDINLYNGTASATLFTEDGTLVAVHNQPELTLQPATSVYEDFSQIQSRIAVGETFISLSPDGRSLRVFSPIKIGDAGQWWFSLIVPFSAITAPATISAVREAVISSSVIILSLLVLWYLTGRLVRPILALTTVANAVSAGNLNAVAKVEAENEIGILANTFNSMTSQLREILTSLEQRVAARTRNLELAAEVGRSVSQVRALDVMLKDACELILKEFNLYYVQVYLTDLSGSTLKLEAGTGTVGAQLVGRGHSLPLDSGSINGRAATDKRSVVISDTAQSATFRQNPLLPDTRGEMAVPLIVANRVVGVLDMQSSQPGVLTDEVVPAFEALAGQLAVAIQNANLLAETNEARAEVEKQARHLVRASWNEHMDAIHKPQLLGLVFDRKEVKPIVELAESQSDENANLISSSISVTGQPLGSLVVKMNDYSRSDQVAELTSAVARQVAQQIENLRLLESAERYRYEAEQAARRQTLEGWRKYVQARSAESLGYLYDTNQVRPHGNSKDEAMFKFALPLKARDEMIGKLFVEDLASEDQEAVNLANEIAERLSAHIENLRLHEQTRHGQMELSKRAQDLAAVSEISSASAKELHIQKLLESVVHLTQRKFGLYHAHIFTFDEMTSELQIAACGWKEGEEHEGTHGTTTIALSQDQSLVARAGRTRQPVIVNDVSNEPGWLPNPMLPDTRSEMAVPVIIGDQLLGVLDVQSDRLNAFSQEDASIQVTLAAQIATALQNARSFEQAQRQAERESIVNMIGQKIQSATSVEAVLQIAARELGRAFGAQFSVAQLGVHAKNGKNKLAESSN